MAQKCLYIKNISFIILKNNMIQTYTNFAYLFAFVLRYFFDIKTIILSNKERARIKKIKSYARPPDVGEGLVCDQNIFMI